MADADVKMKKNDASVEDFLSAVDDEIKREDSKKIIEMMKEVTGEQPVMWGSSIIGFGEYHYKYASGHEGDAPRAGFSPRKQNITIYTLGFDGYEKLLEKLGKCKTSKACLYIKRLSDIDETVLRQIIKSCFLRVQELYP